MSPSSNISRKAIILIMITALLAASLSIPAYAKSKVKLSKSKLTITEGKSTTLKLSGTTAKATWTVSGRKLVTIKTSGKKRHKAVIKAKKGKSGNCVIKVKVGKKTLNCKVTVKSAKDPEPKPEPEPDKFTNGVTDTSVSMLKYLCATEKDPNRNILISPDSILTAMAMAENGAENNTLAEMEKAFGNIPVEEFSESLSRLNGRLTESKAVKYHIANSIWYKDNEDDIKVNESFIQKNLEFFGAETFKAPFSNETIEQINAWVNENTKGMIKKIIDDFNKDTVMLLINAIAFEGEWADQYEEGNVKNQPFYNEDGTVQKKVDMLCGTEDTYIEVKGAEGFIKRYKGGEIAFMGLETPDGMTVDQFIQSLSGDDLIKGYYNRTNEYIVKTRMPEFKYDYDASLVDSLYDLGIHDAFNSFTADFTGIAPKEQPLVISDVLHKTHIELDRNGTKAAAVTAVVIEKASAAPEQKKEKTVDLDHPFVYAIIDTESGIPLFIGTVKTV